MNLLLRQMPKVIQQQQEYAVLQFGTGQRRQQAPGKPSALGYRLRLEMLALVRLSRFEEAETLVEKSADSDLKADYASLLLDTGNMERVSRFMAQNSQR